MTSLYLPQRKMPERSISLLNCFFKGGKPLVEESDTISRDADSVVSAVHIDIPFSKFVIDLNPLVLILEFVVAPSQVLQPIVVGNAVDVVYFGEGIGVG